MAHSNSPLRRCSACTFGVSLLLLSGEIALAQQPASATTPGQPEALTASIRELQEQVRELRAAIKEIRSESARYRARTLELRQELQATKGQLGSSSGQTLLTAPSQHAATSLSPLPQYSGRTQEQTQTASIDERVARLERGVSASGQQD